MSCDCMSTDQKRNLEHLNFQQAGKQELKMILKKNALKIALKASLISKNKNKKYITKEDVEEALKN